MNAVASSYVPQRQTVNLLALFLSIMFISICATYFATFSNYVLIIFFLVFFLSLLCLYWPMAGVYLLILVFPVQSIAVHLSIALHPPFTSYFYQYFALIILPVLIIHLINNRSGRRVLQSRVMRETRWLLFISLVFAAWTPFTLIWSQNPYLFKMLAGLWKHNCNFVLCAYLLVHINSLKRFKRVLLTWSGVGVLLSIASIYSMRAGFDKTFNLIRTTGFSANLEATFFNRGGGFDPAYLGMAPAFGLSAKHELGLFLCSSIIIVLFFLKTYKSWGLRTVFGTQLLLYATVLYLAVTKASILALVIGTVLVCFFVADWRKYMPALIGGILVLFMLAATFSSFITPLKNVSSISLMSQLPKDSAYEKGTYAHRLALMGHGIMQVQSSYGLGGGPDIMDTIPPEYLHSHNLLLGYANDFGMIGLLFVVSVLIILGNLARKIVFHRPRPQEPSWLLVCTMTTCLLITFFESLTDVYIWYPQIWILGTLLLTAMKLDNFGNPVGQFPTSK